MAAQQRDARGRFIPRPEPELMIAKGTRKAIASLDHRAAAPNDRLSWIVIAALTAAMIMSGALVSYVVLRLFGWM